MMLYELDFASVRIAEPSLADKRLFRILIRVEQYTFSYSKNHSFPRSHMKQAIYFFYVVSTLLFASWQPITAAEEPIAEVTASQELQQRPYLIFTGNANEELTQKIVQQLNMELGKSTVKRFNDGEINIKIDENVRNLDVFVVQPTCTGIKGSVNDHIMELYLMVRALKRASAGSVTAVIPYYGYARQDRKSASRVPISASDVAMLLETAGVDRVVSVDLHCGQIQGFFHTAPVDNLFASTVLVPYFAGIDLHNPVVISPDAGGVERAKCFREQLADRGVSCGFGIIIKQRAGAGVIETMDLIGDVYDCDVIIVDDMCDTAGTLCKAASELKKFGARRVFAAISHPVFSGKALENIENSEFTEVVVTDTIPLRKASPVNVKQISVAPLLAEVIDRIFQGKSVSEVFAINRN